MQIISFTNYFIERLPEIWQRLGEHIFLTGISTLTAALAGIPLAMLAFYRPRLRGPLLGAVGILQTIPSLAMLVLLLALFQKIGVLPAIVALILYALLPIVRNTLAALSGIAPEIVEAALAIGMTVDDVEEWPDRIGAVTVEAVNAAARAVLKEGRSVTSELLQKKTG